MRFALAAVIAVCIPTLLLGSGGLGSIGFALPLVVGSVGVAIGAGCWFLLRRLAVPKMWSRLLLRTVCGVLSGAVTSVLAWMIGIYAWYGLHLSGDAESYTWLMLLGAISSGIVSILFGAGLGQPGWRDNQCEEH